MRRRGFALLAVLWIIAVLSTLVAASTTHLRTEHRAAANRLALARGRWAAEACWAIAQARWRAPLPTERPVSLGRDVHCDWQVDDPAERLNINTVAAPQLTRLLVACGMSPMNASTLTVRIATRRSSRPYEDSTDIAVLDGLPACARPLLDVRGSTAVSASAPRQVLLSLPGANDEVVTVLAGRRSTGRPVGSLAELEEYVSPVTRASLEQYRAELVERLAFRPTVLRLRADGWVGTGRGPRATLELLVVPEANRLPVLVKWVR